MVKTFVVETPDVEYHIYALDLDDALNTYDGNAEDIICIKEYENKNRTDTLH